eukprot:TRINITY_DN95981_c0_g1_i1.p1 TRINITY_DN95981_c0_g1~~TRINITY_DN95981_c0_g1_i1.p1  ORF type:complete len:223 (+),score=36.80 TRINITY_DN95981_c0_g1_i1:161-829(+)
MKRFSESTLASQYAGVHCSDAFACFGDVDGEVEVHTQVLRIASPVFDAMFSSGMMEVSTKRIRIEVASKTDFVSFYHCLLPGASSAQHVTPENVDGILELSNYYQVQFLKDACIRVLSRCPASIPRLLQAKKLALQDLYDKFLKEIMETRDKHDLSILKPHADILLDCVEAASETRRQNLAELKPYVEHMYAHVGRSPVGTSYDGVAALDMHGALGQLINLL